MIGHRWADDDLWSMSVTTEKITGFDAWRAPFRTAIAGRDLTGELDEPNFFGVLKRQYHEWTFQGVAYQTSMPELNIDSGDPRNNGELQDKLFSLYAKREHPYGDDLTGIFIADSTFKQQTRLNQDGPPIPGSTKEKCLTQMEYSGELALKYTGVDRHVIQVGSQFDYFDAFNCFWNYVQLSPYEVWNHAPLIQGDMNEVGVYLDDEFQVNDRLKLIGGVRQDHDSALPGNGWYTGIRSAIVLETAENWTTKAMFNRSVRFPSMQGALMVGWGQGVPNDPSWATLAPICTEPEILSTVELDNVFHIEKARIGINIYHEELSNFISWIGPTTNVGQFCGTGEELAYEIPYNPSNRIWGNVAHVDSQLIPFENYRYTPGAIVEQQHALVNPEGRIVGSPEWTANLGLDSQINEHLLFSPSIARFHGAGCPRL